MLNWGESKETKVPMEAERSEGWWRKVKFVRVVVLGMFGQPWTGRRSGF
jgi:hypothetical protein